MRHALALLLLVGGCDSCRQQAPSRPQIAALTFRDDSTEALVALLSEARVREIGARVLAPAFDVTPLSGHPPREDAYRCEVRLRTVGLRDGGGALLLRSLAEATCKRPDSLDDPPLEASAAVERLAHPKDAGVDPAAPPSSALLTEHAQRAIADVLGGVADDARLRSGDESVLLAALASTDTERRRAAVRAAGDRKSRAVVPKLIGLLKDPSEEVRDATLGALVQIGDPSAVKPMVSDIQFRDVDSMRKILDAVAQIGGREATEYLEFVAEGHDDAEVKAIAKKALERLRRKQDAR